MTDLPPVPQPTPEATGRIPILDPLRGLAALAVMWFHFTNGGHLFDGAGLGRWLLKASGVFGWTGVEFFFVISGFVLPYALQRGGYRLRDYVTFLGKRLLRLEPPYLVSVALALVLWWAGSRAPAFHGAPFALEWPRLLLHLGYLNSHFGYEPYNPVYWTLGIELQFYLALALLYPLFVSRKTWLRSAAPGALLLLSLVPGNRELIPAYLPLFTLGILTFQRHAGLLSTTGWLIGLAISGAFGFFSTSLPATLAGVAAAVAIGGFPGPSIPPTGVGGRIWRGLAWSGRVSYSLYLLHVLIGGRVLNLGIRLNPGLSGSIVILAVATAATLAASWALHRWVEAPAQRLSSRITFQSEE